MRRIFCGIAVASLVWALPAHADKKCQLQQYAQLPVTMAGTAPHITGTINGQPAVFLLDSGAFFSALREEAADKFKLSLGPLPNNMYIRGLGGNQAALLGKAKEFTLNGLGNGHVFNRVDFVVGHNIIGGDVDGIIGQNILGSFDSEYDLANGVVRLFRAENCSGRMLAYWAGSNPVGEVEIESRTLLNPHLIGSAKLNGKKIRVMFDTGAWRSMLEIDAAKKVGIKPENDDVVAGEIAHGIGKNTVETWLARFDSLDLGGEVIKNARLRIGDVSMVRGDMLLGADFFLSHRVYVASRQNKIYFTYNGGPVFDLRRTNSRPATQATVATTSADPSPTSPAGENTTAEQPVAASVAGDVDASEFRRRGVASAARQDFASAIAELDQAVKLNASDPENFYQRGLAHWQNRQPRLAMDDFDAAIKLKPDYIQALIARGSLRMRVNEAAARADFDSALAVAPNDPNSLQQISQAFMRAGKFDDAIASLSKWISGHPKDDALPTVLNERCFARALANKEMELALEDCNLAIKKGPSNSAVYDSRGLVYLRLGQWDKSIADYDKSIKLQPKSAWPLYGRGLAKQKKGLKAESDKDMQNAIAIDPKVIESYRRIGYVS
jgi:tetratricopeptide (TPR) repeat protein/predicted aspartyl protease